MHKLSTALVSTIVSCTFLASASYGATINILAGQTTTVIRPVTLDGRSGSDVRGTLNLVFRTYEEVTGGNGATTTVTEDGRLTNNSRIVVHSTGMINNQSTFTNNRLIENDGTINSNGTFDNNGMLVIIGSPGRMQAIDTGVTYTAYQANPTASKFDVINQNPKDIYFDISGNAIYLGVSDPSKGGAVFYNSGTLTNGGLISNDSVFDNSGTFTNKSNRSGMAGGCSIPGTSPRIDDCNAILINNGLLLNSGTFDNHDTLTNNNLLVNNGSLTNLGTLTNNGALTNFGIFENKGVVISDQDATFTNGRNATLINWDTFIADGVLNNDGDLTNEGTLTTSVWLANSATGTLSNKGTLKNTRFITNDGTFTNSGSLDNAGTVTNNGSLDNAGTLANSGILSNFGDVTNQGTFTNSGAVNLAAGSTFGGAGTFTQTAGSLTVDGTMQQDAVSINGGSVGGSGTIQSNLALFDALIGPGTGNIPGILTIDGNLDLTGGSTLAFGLGGTSAGTGYNQLNVLGGATLGVGTTFAINFLGGFIASSGDFFDVLVAGDFGFADLNGFTFDVTGASGFNWGTSIVAFGSSQQAVRLTALPLILVAPVPVPASAILLLGGLVGLGAAGRRKRKAV